MAAATYESSLLLRIILMAFILSLNDTQLTHCKHARNHWAMASAESTMPRLGTCRIDGEYMMQISAKLASFVAAAVYVQWCAVFEGSVTHASKLFFILIPIRLRHCAVLQLETWAIQNTGPCKTLVFDLFLNSDRLVVIITNLRLVAYYQLNFDRSCFFLYDIVKRGVECIKKCLAFPANFIIIISNGRNTSCWQEIGLNEKRGWKGPSIKLVSLGLWGGVSIRLVKIEENQKLAKNSSFLFFGNQKT